MTTSARVLLPLAILLALPGCLPLAAVPGAVVGAIGLYCVAVSEDGKQMTRDTVSDGVALIACPQPTPAPETRRTPQPTLGQTPSS